MLTRVLTLLLLAAPALAQDAAPPAPSAADQARIEAIRRVFPNVPRENITILNGVGKVDVDATDKVSYYIMTENPADPASRMALVPMSTSRFDRYNYHTPEWWEANRDALQQARFNHTPVPREDPQAVAAYLRSRGLSTNPNVHFLHPTTRQQSTQPLREYLLDQYLSRFSRNGTVTLYRGAEKAGELEGWQSGIVPRGVRYWTPDANYAWRYGRKDGDYLNRLVNNTTPVFRYEVPEEEFVQMVRRGELVLGTEITRSVHNGFDYQGRFIDTIGGYDYMGDGRNGFEWEIRATRRARERFPSYFRGAATVDELAEVRSLRIREATERLSRANPARAAELQATQAIRLQQVQTERELIHAIQQGRPEGEINALLERLRQHPAEITDSFSGQDIETVAREEAARRRAAAPPAAAANAARADCHKQFAKITP